MASSHSAIAKLEELAPKLNAATDEIAATIETVEQFLRGLSVGIDVQVAMSTDERVEDLDGQPPREVTCEYQKCLAYERYDGNYRLIVRTFRTVCSDGTFTVHEEIPWQQCSRSVKIEITEALPSLIETLEARVIEVLDSSTKAQASVRAMLGEQAVSRRPLF